MFFIIVTNQFAFFFSIISQIIFKFIRAYKNKNQLRYNFNWYLSKKIMYTTFISRALDVSNVCLFNNWIDRMIIKLQHTQYLFVYLKKSLY
jgi:hypothetical protein